MDALELVVGDGHAEERVEAIVRMNEFHEVCHEGLDLDGALRWFVDGLSCGFVSQDGAGEFSEARVVLFQFALNSEDGVEADEAGF